MASKVLLDANVLLDFTLKRKGYADTKTLMELILSGKIKGFVTATIIHIIGY